MANEYIISKLLQPHVLPPLPPFPKGEKQIINSAGAIDAMTVEAAAGDKVEQTIFGTPQVAPFKIKFHNENKYWLLPVEPLISIDGKNILVKRNVAKRTVGFGTIKEYWTQDDWVINVQGLLTTPNAEEFPGQHLLKLRQYLTAAEPLDVLCPLFDNLGITRIVVETYSFPFTKGPENQNYSFTAYSDKDWSLLIKKDTDVL